MLLAAWELGVGGCPATVYEPKLAAEILGIPEGRYCGYILSFGYPADPADLVRPPEAGGRRPLESVVHRERW
jgi:nitroreductase